MAGRCALKMLKLVRVIGDPPTHKATADKRVTRHGGQALRLYRYKIRGRQKRKARSSGPFLRFSESYCFGSGSAAKFAWTNIHLLSFFT